MTLTPDTIGSAMVTEALGRKAGDLRQLHAPGSPEMALADLVHTSAQHLDDVHRTLVAEARHVAETLTRVAAGTKPVNSLGILQLSGLGIDILAARRADAITRLKAVIHVYQRTVAAGGTTPARPHTPAPTPPARRSR